jgi:hypothetical protein
MEQLGRGHVRSGEVVAVRRRLWTSGLLGLFLLICVAAGPRATLAAGERCDRDCLDGFVDQYLNGLIAHDPSRLPLAKNVKFTEDGVQLKLGDALWATATGLGGYKLYFAEPETGGVGAFALIQENGTPAILLVRLKVVKHQIAEIETLVARKQTTSLLNTNNLTTPPPVFLETVPAADRPSREEMVAIVNKYFDGIEQGNGDIVPFDKDCVRIENGVQTCPSSLSSRLGALSCGAQLSTKIFTYIQSVSPRRFAIVDSERGLVLALVRFNHPGSQQTVDVPGRGVMRMGAFSEWPNSTQIAELFKVQNRKIREITAVIVTRTYKAPTGWE